MKKHSGSPQCVMEIGLSHSLAGHHSTGISRVQRKLAQYCLEQKDVPIRFCRLDYEKGRFLQLSRTEAERIVTDDGRRTAASREERKKAGSKKNHSDKSQKKDKDLVFLENDVLILTDAMWTDDYSYYVLKAKKESRIKTIHVHYDIAPILAPQLFPLIERCRAFERAVIDMLLTADRILCLSEAARTDLAEYARSRGLEVGPARMGVITLGSDPVMQSDALKPSRELVKFAGRPFILYVSSVEPRKNHDLLCNIWRRLCSSRNDVLPLVIVGPIQNAGFVLQKMVMDPVLTEKICIIDNASDDDVLWLYANCLFTVFPSFYEGWGLPVSEGLAHGKYCVASSTSSLPEAGQGLIKHIDPLDFAAWYKEIDGLMKDPAPLGRLEKRIRKEYEPVSWQQCGKNFLREVRLVMDGTGKAEVAGR